MDGPISAYEAAGSASQQAAHNPYPSEAAGSPERVGPVSEGSASRSAGRDEVRESARREERTEQSLRSEDRQGTRKQPPAYVVEIRETEKGEPPERASRRRSGEQSVRADQREEPAAEGQGRADRAGDKAFREGPEEPAGRAPGRREDTGISPERESRPEDASQRPVAEERTVPPSPDANEPSRTSTERIDSDLKSQGEAQRDLRDAASQAASQVAADHASARAEDSRADADDLPRTDDRARDAIPLAGEARERTEPEDLAEAIGRTKERWAEVNREALEAREPAGREEQGDEEEEEEAAADIQSFPDPSRYASPAPNGTTIYTPRFSPSSDSALTSRALDPAEPLGPPEVSVTDAGQQQAAMRYQSFAMALSNPHQARPVIDVFA